MFHYTGIVMPELDLCFSSNSGFLHTFTRDRKEKILQCRKETSQKSAGLNLNSVTQTHKLRLRICVVGCLMSSILMGAMAQGSWSKLDCKNLNNSIGELQVTLQLPIFYAA